jgi:hypothetical protein
MLLAPRSDCYRATFPEFLHFVLGYAELLTFAWDARDQQLLPRANPVPLIRFFEMGIAEPPLLWMLYQGQIEHLHAACTCQPEAAEIKQVDSLHFQETSCFTLTEAGEAFADYFLADALVPVEEGAHEAIRATLLLGQLDPCYDKEIRTLSWGRHILKRFRQPSGNQEIILCAAEELSWPLWFDDPLPKQPGSRPKTRCHDTIKDLNRRQTPHLIHFKGDGTGMRIGWEYR